MTIGPDPMMRMVLSDGSLGTAASVAAEFNTVAGHRREIVGGEGVSCPGPCPSPCPTSNGRARARARARARRGVWRPSPLAPAADGRPPSFEDGRPSPGHGAGGEVGFTGAGLVAG